jgi:hypothetical protein
MLSKVWRKACRQLGSRRNPHHNSQHSGSSALAASQLVSVPHRQRHCFHIEDGHWRQYSAQHKHWNTVTSLMWHGPTPGWLIRYELVCTLGVGDGRTKAFEDWQASL